MIYMATDFGDLWARVLKEIAGADALVSYVEPGETLKGSLVEVGAALAIGVPVFWVGAVGGYTVAMHPSVWLCDSLDDAMRRASA